MCLLKDNRHFNLLSGGDLITHLYDLTVVLVEGQFPEDAGNPKFFGVAAISQDRQQGLKHSCSTTEQL